jgi:universal stress protein A
MKTIACCTDFSENAEKAFVTAKEMAEKYNAKLIMIHVMPPVVNPILTESDPIIFTEPDKSLVLNLEERMQQEYGNRVGDNIQNELVVLNGHVSSEILRYLDENPIDLIIMGSFGLTGMGLVLFGSVAKRVAHKAPCSVMIVRLPDEDAV